MTPVAATVGHPDEIACSQSNDNSAKDVVHGVNEKLSHESNAEVPTLAVGSETRAQTNQVTNRRPLEFLFWPMAVPCLDFAL